MDIMCCWDRELELAQLHFKLRLPARAGLSRGTVRVTVTATVALPGNLKSVEDTIGCHVTDDLLSYSHCHCDSRGNPARLRRQAQASL